MAKKNGWIVHLMAAMVVAAITASCGYQLVTEKGIFGGDISSVSLGAFKNVTYEPHASLYVTNAFSQELISTGLFQLNKPGADAYLEGTIQRILVVPSSMNAQGVVIEKQATINVDITLYKKNGEFIRRWMFTDTEPYRVDDVQAEDYNKRIAFQTISGRMARKFAAVVLIDY